jgi:regulator of cell morphogenesis and NO signaling
MSHGEEQLNTKNKPDWANSSLSELVAHLLGHHHPYTKAALEKLAPLLDKVLHKHGDQHPELHELNRLFIELRDDMGRHLLKEENILFPYVLALESGQSLVAPFGTIAMPIRMMSMEHAHDSLILQKMRAISNNFTLPIGACNSYTALYAGLQELVDDLFEHIYLENEIAFPKAIAAEKILKERT